MINEGYIASDIATRLDISKPLVSYYIKKAKDSDYVRTICQDTFKGYELTQPGKNFVAKYRQEQEEKQALTISKICRAALRRISFTML